MFCTMTRMNGNSLANYRYVEDMYCVQAGKDENYEKNRR